jgi:hypothetical protein
MVPPEKMPPEMNKMHQDMHPKMQDPQADHKRPSLLSAHGNGGKKK